MQPPQGVLTSTSEPHHLINPASLDSDGYRILPVVLGPAEVNVLRITIEQVLARAVGRGGARNVFEEPTLAAFAAGTLLQLARAELGAGAFAVRGLVFDKTPLANWRVAWHQDVTIAVTERRDCDGWGPWSQKAGTWHVRPPVEVLEGMLAVRLHLDDCNAANGPLRVISGSHRAGRLSDSEIAALSQSGPSRVCLVPAGGILLMRPLLLHASAPATVPDHRRVVHIEYAAAPLPDRFVWAEQLAGAA